MFRTPNEKTTAQLRWVDGRSIREIAAATGEDKSTIVRRLKTLAACLRQLNVNPDNPERVREFVADTLRRCQSIAA